MSEPTQKELTERRDAFYAAEPQLNAIFDEFFEERLRQDLKWGEQNHPDGTGSEFKEHADIARAVCERVFKEGNGTYRHILAEEINEAFAESDEEALIMELTQSAAVIAAWIQCIRRRQARRASGQEAQGQDGKK